jgi:hypothetical protein
MAGDIRLKVDGELTKRVGTWFTVREIQDTLRINPATLKPLLMKYARENLLKRRHVKGTARSVQFTPAAGSKTSFGALLTKTMPYRKFLKARGATNVLGVKVVKSNAAPNTAVFTKKALFTKKAATKTAVTKKSAVKGRAFKKASAAARTGTRRSGARKTR